MQNNSSDNCHLTINLQTPATLNEFSLEGMLHFVYKCCAKQQPAFKPTSPHIHGAFSSVNLVLELLDVLGQTVFHHVAE